MQATYGKSRLFPSCPIRLVLFSDRKLRDLVLQLECLGFLTLKTRRKYPNQIPMFGAEALENMLTKLEVPQGIIAVAKEVYEWEFRSLITDLSSGHFFANTLLSHEAFDLNKAKSEGRAVLSAFEALVDQIRSTDPRIEKIEGWPRLLNEQYPMEASEQFLECEDALLISYVVEIEQLMAPREQISSAIN